MNFLEAVILGIVQGVTEFLPISSSGHLAVLQSFFGITEGNLFFTEMLHLGTLISIIIVYFKDIKLIVIDFIKLIVNILKRKRQKLTKHQKLGLLIIAGSVPTAIIGLSFEDFFESLYTSLLPIGISFIITGMLLWIAEKKSKTFKDVKDMTFLDSILIGTFQGLAIVPGISRSGSTIVMGLFRGLKKPLATEFSFLLALPATLGAVLLGLIKVSRGKANAVINFSLIIGVVLSCIVGVLSIKALIKILNKNKLHYFSYYLWILGAFITITQLIK